MTQPTPAVHRTIVVVDVAGFTHPNRKLSDQYAVREGMYEVLATAFAESDIDLGSCTREDRGDGVLILVPPNVPKSMLADRLPERLVSALRRYNSTRADRAQFKLRVGLHAGDIRQDNDGWVGPAVNLAFRILDASDAKIALAESDRMVALITSDYFYDEVIYQDPGTAPETYRQISVLVKTFAGTAWMRLLGDGMPGVLPRPRDDRVLDVIPSTELDGLRERLKTEEFPRLPALIGRVAGSAIPLPRQEDMRSPLDAVEYFAEFNAGPNGIPPAMLFLEYFADEVGGEFGDDIRTWTAEQVRRLRLAPALEDHRRARVPLPDEPHLHLVIMLEPDRIDPEHTCVLSFWRQDDPLEWPPPRGGVREIDLGEVEYRVDEVIVAAERVWAGQAVSAAVEFLLPRTLLHLPVRRWHKEYDSGQPRPLRYDYRLSLRSLERMKSKHWHRAWNQRWDSMLEDPSSGRLYISGSAEFKEHPIEAVLSNPSWVGLVMAETPSPQPERGGGQDEWVAALRAGIPVILWHPDAGPEDLRQIADWLLGGESGFMDLPARLRMMNSSTTVPFNDLVPDLVVLWDDPKRVIVLDQPLTPSQQ